MAAGLLESYQPRPSPIHRLRARTKLLGLLAYVLGVVGLPQANASTPLVFGGTGLLIVFTAVYSRLNIAFLLRRLLLLEPFVLGVAALSLWQTGGVTVFWHTVARSTLCLSGAILLAATTPFSEIIRALRAWHVPALLLTTLALMDRYLFVLVEESGRMTRARASRTFSPRSRWTVWSSLAEMLGQLFVRSVERAGRIYSAMCARGWKE